MARWLLWLPAAALAGLPLTSGALAKLAWKTSLPQHWQALEIWLTLSSFATTLLLLRFLALCGVFGRRHSGAVATDAQPWPWPWLLLLLAVLLLPWYFVGRYLAPFVDVALLPAYQFDLLVPIGAALLLTLIAVLLVRFAGLKTPSFPPGDLINLLPSMPVWRLPRFALPAQPDWQAPLVALQRHWQQLTPALVLAALWLLVLFVWII
jgi:hypothetical protein